VVRVGCIELINFFNRLSRLLRVEARVIPSTDKGIKRFGVDRNIIKLIDDCMGVHLGGRNWFHRVNSMGNWPKKTVWRL
jgi:hypothetical protein